MEGSRWKHQKVVLQYKRAETRVETKQTIDFSYRKAFSRDFYQQLNSPRFQLDIPQIIYGCEFRYLCVLAESVVPLRDAIAIPANVTSPG